jgi:hypothetical protein
VARDTSSCDCFYNNNCCNWACKHPAFDRGQDKGLELVLFGVLFGDCLRMGSNTFSKVILRRDKIMPCTDCLFFVEIDCDKWSGEEDEDRYGECHRYPPSISPYLFTSELDENQPYWVFAFIDRAQDWWCGEIKNRGE